MDAKVQTTVNYFICHFCFLFFLRRCFVPLWFFFNCRHGTFYAEQPNGQLLRCHLDLVNAISVRPLES